MTLSILLQLVQFILAISFKLFQFLILYLKLLHQSNNFIDQLMIKRSFSLGIFLRYNSRYLVRGKKSVESEIPIMRKPYPYKFGGLSVTSEGIQEIKQFFKIVSGENEPVQHLKSQYKQLLQTVSTSTASLQKIIQNSQLISAFQSRKVKLINLQGNIDISFNELNICFGGSMKQNNSNYSKMNGTTKGMNIFMSADSMSNMGAGYLPLLYSFGVGLRSQAKLVEGMMENIENSYEVHQMCYEIQSKIDVSNFASLIQKMGSKLMQNKNNTQMLSFFNKSQKRKINNFDNFLQSKFK